MNKDEINSNINGVIFCTHFLAFTKQAVKGIILSSYEFMSKIKKKEEIVETFRDGNFFLENLIRYINECWKQLNDKNENNNNDDYVKRKFDFMKTYGGFKHNSCIFDVVWDFSQKLLIYTLGRIGLPELKDKEFLSECLEIITDSILSTHVENLMYLLTTDDFICGDKCHIREYKINENFLNIKKFN
jgi:hypothetical protein